MQLMSAAKSRHLAEAGFDCVSLAQLALVASLADILDGLTELELHQTARDLAYALSKRGYDIIDCFKKSD
jgi:hypothetical protein